MKYGKIGIIVVFIHILFYFFRGTLGFATKSESALNDIKCEMKAENMGQFCYKLDSKAAMRKVLSLGFFINFQKIN